MNEQQEFVQALASIMGVNNQEELEAGINNLGEKGIALLYQQYKQVKNNGPEGLKLLKQTYNKLMEQKQLYAKLGAKLDYINQLRGKCPEGYEVEKFMAGGCVKCKKKQQEGGQIVERFKSEKCGGKMKKRVKKGQSGSKVTLKKETHTDDGETVTTTRFWSDGTRSKRVATEGGTEYYGRRGEAGLTNVPNAKQNAVADSLHRADWSKKQAKPIKKRYFGGILDKWL